MSWLETKYINIVSRQLGRFRQTDNGLYNFRCPICGDSAKQKNKARGYIYNRNGNYLFFCHNCHASMAFYNFLKKVSPNLYDDYLTERYRDGAKEDKALPFVQKKILISSNEPLKKLKKISQLPADHPCKKYITSRQIPSPYHSEIFFCPQFKEWTNSIIPDKFDLKVGKDEPRLIIPLMDENNVMFGFQGRSLNPKNKVRYITIMMNEDKPKLYNLHKVNMNVRYYIMEGPFDSMFVPNSIAMCGGVLTREMDVLNKNTSNAVVVYDNEPRNKEIVQNLLTAVSKGYKVCVWPSSTKFKDINDMVLDRVGSYDFVNTEKVKLASLAIKQIIDQNTFSGLEAELKVTGWKRI